MDLGVREGARIAVAALRDAHAAHETARAIEKGVSLIAAREHARAEIERKLEQRGFSAASTELALSRLEEYGYLDDARFAETYIRERLRRHPEGRMALAAGLAKRGVAPPVAARVLDEVVNEEVELDALERAARKLASDGRGPDKLAVALLRRGFPPAAVRGWIRDHEI